MRSNSVACSVRPYAIAFVSTGTATWLRSLLDPLLGNAAKYTPNSGRILLQLEQHQEQAILSISDNGIGFPPSESNRILEPFTQMDTSRTREYGGLGIGLSIVRQIVELHGGTLTPESRGPGTGSRFTVVLPLTAAEPIPVNNTVPPVSLHEQGLTLSVQGQAEPTTKAFATVAQQTTCEANPASSHPSVLIVEDNVDAAAALCELLQLEGFEVSVAHDAVAALKALEQAIPKVMLMDIGLPGMDGYQLARRIRGRYQSADICLIACTGWGGEADRQAAKDAGFDFHLVKPVNFTDLISLLEQGSQRQKLSSFSCLNRSGPELDESNWVAATATT